LQQLFVAEKQFTTCLVLKGDQFLKWYIEEQTKDLRKAFEKEVLEWTKVDCKKMFGCPCYLANGSMFAGLVTKGIVITKLTTGEKQQLSKFKEVGPFVAGEKVIKSWVQLKLEPNELPDVLPFVKKSYERAFKIKN
jgi:hypothetical protein